MAMNQQLYEEATHSSVLSKEFVGTLLDSMEYSSISFINWAIDILRILKTRLDRGDVITDEKTGITYTASSFKKFVKEHFSSYIYSQVFSRPQEAQKAYFRLEACEDGYNLVMADSSREKTYEWISSLSERFSLVKMVFTGIVYVKDNKTNTYTPFISEHGKYCRYDNEKGRIIEL